MSQWKSTNQIEESIALLPMKKQRSLISDQQIKKNKTQIIHILVIHIFVTNACLCNRIQINNQKKKLKQQNKIQNKPKKKQVNYPSHGNTLDDVEILDHQRTHV